MENFDKVTNAGVETELAQTTNIGAQPSPIDPSTITITNSQRAVQESADGDGVAPIEPPSQPDKSGEGGETGAATPPSPLSPPLVGDHAVPTSNSAFLQALFSEVRADETLLVCSKSGDPAMGGWQPRAAQQVDRHCPPSANNYYCCSTVRPDIEGGLNARKESFVCFRVLVLDDVGTKVPVGKVAGLSPTYILETSPDNFQYGYVLAAPLEDIGEVSRLQAAVVAAGLSDAGAMGAMRWARQPVAVNGKPKYQKDGNSFHCRLTQWNPERRFTVDELYKGLGLDAIPLAPTTMARALEPRYALPTGLSHDVYRPSLPENPVITALREEGLYKREIEPGKHEISCPWVEEHTDHLDSGSAYFEPSPTYPTGGFKCHHSHGDRYGIGHVLGKLGVDARAARNKPEIRYEPGSIDQVVTACDYVLSLSGSTYQSGGTIVELRRDDPGKDVRADVATHAELTMAIAASCSFLGYSRRDKEWRPCDPPERVIRTLAGASRYKHLRRLNGIARQPFYRPNDGSLVVASGYDEQSGIYGAFEGERIVLGAPTLEGAEAALRSLEALLCEFRFETENDKAAALSAMMTATVRPSLKHAPAFLTTAPESGTGKSYLNRIITGFAGGQPARASFPLTADEATKSLLSLLISAPPCIEYDDMVGNFKPHAILNRALTSEFITDRILSVSKTATVSTRVFIIGSGINVAPERDMNRRVITIKLASCPENRIKRTFEGQPAEVVQERRMEMVSAVLTIIEAWKAAGQPKGDVPSIATYGDDWADYCRHPLIWLGLPDPAQSLFDQVEDDNDSELLGNLLKIWFDCFGTSAVAVRQVVERAHHSDRLAEALEDLPVGDGKSINPAKLGWYISKHAKRIVGGLRFVQARADGRRGWRVEKVAKVEGTAPLSPPSTGAGSNPD